MNQHSAIVHWNTIQDFVHRADQEYRAAESGRRPPRQWAIVTGTISGPVIEVCAVHYGHNRRHDNDLVSQWFGGTYHDVRRGYWCDAEEALAITQWARAARQQVLGSIHLHAGLANAMDRDYYPAEMRALRPTRPRPTSQDGEVWSCSQNSFVVSEAPSPMDQEMFLATGWPLNLILFLDERDSQLQRRLAAWSATERLEMSIDGTPPQPVGETFLSPPRDRVLSTQER